MSILGMPRRPRKRRIRFFNLGFGSTARWPFYERGGMWFRIRVGPCALLVFRRPV